MKVKNYRHLLDSISKTKPVIVTISLWTYSSKRQVFHVPFDQIRPYVDGDMVFNYGDFRVNFTTIGGDKFSFHMYKLKIIKIDVIEIKEGNDGLDN